MKYNKLTIIILIIILLSANNSAQTGGDFTITHSVIASGGGQNSLGVTFAVDGTIGQAVAGNASSGAPFAVTSGFWNFTPLVPTETSVTIGGRVRTADGRGISNVRVILTEPHGATRTARTASLGYYHFEEIPVGETYIITVYSKRFTFSQPSVIRTILESITNLEFIADSN